MATLTCPTCARSFQPEETRAMPFCSDRCRQIDLGRWLDEKQSLPHVPSPEEEEKELQGDLPSD
jgi:endogenous inhibitor of DNA gyrase (YacG/DUF329 family)